MNQCLSDCIIEVGGGNKNLRKEKEKNGNLGIETRENKVVKMTTRPNSRLPTKFWLIFLFVSVHIVIIDF